MSQVMETPVLGASHTEYMFFAGDHVQLAGQIDYPITPMPEQGYPLIFVIQHATCNTRNGYAHIARLGVEMGMAVFRWDKRGTGNSGSGSGVGTLDPINAYQTALKQPGINPQAVFILAQNEGSLLLHDTWNQFRQVALPAGVVLAGNMLDQKAITALNVPVTTINSKNDWHAWQIYSRDATAAHHTRYPQWPQSYFVATNSNQRLMYENGGTFNRGVAQHIRDWLMVLCQPWL